MSTPSNKMGGRNTPKGDHYKNLSKLLDCGVPSALYGTEKTYYVGPLFHSRWVH